jgi:hypothetical protein
MPRAATVEGITYASQLYSATAAAGFRFNEKGLRYADESLDVANFAFFGNIMQQQKVSFSIATDAQIEEWSTIGAPYGGGLMGDAYDVSVAPCSTQGRCVSCGRAAAQYVAEICFNS